MAAKSKLPTRKKAGKKSDPPSSPPRVLSSAEAHDLDAFCEKVQSEEFSSASFAAWEASHTHLDLIVPLWLSPAELLAGGERQIKASRTVRVSPSSPPERQPFSCQVQIPTGCPSGHRLVVKGQGDVTASLAGNLIVIVYTKS